MLACRKRGMTMAHDGGAAGRGKDSPGAGSAFDAHARALLEQVRQLGGGFGRGDASIRLVALDARLPAAKQSEGGPR